MSQNQYERMFLAACDSLGRISQALGIPPEEADDGPDRILEAIEDLKRRAPDEPREQFRSLAESRASDMKDFDFWWRALTVRGDPSRMLNVPRDAFLAGAENTRERVRLGKETLAVETSGEPKLSRMLVHSICHAYESGFGRGQSKRDLAQPYAAESPQALAYFEGYTQAVARQAASPVNASGEPR